MNLIQRISSVVFAISIVAPMAQAQHLTILSANDTHSTIHPANDGLGGYVRHKAIVDSVRNADENVIAIHCGDAVQGSPYFSIFKGDVEYAMHDSIGYDICILGNHEFDNHINDIAARFKTVKAVKLCSNYDFSGTPCDGMFKPYVIKQYGEKRVAFIGLGVNPEGMIATNNIGAMKYEDATKVALNLSEELKTRGKADYVVVMSHIGYDSYEGGASDVEIARQSRYIDIIFGGHTHTMIEPGTKDAVVKNADGKDVYIIQTGKYGKKMGKVDFDLATGAVKYDVISVDSRFDARAASYTALNAWLKPYDDKVAELMNRRVGTAARTLSSSELSALPNFLTDALCEIIAKRWGKVDFSILNRGGIRMSLNKGDIGEGAITSMLPFDNRLVVLKIKGSDILEGLKVMTMRDGDAVSKQLDVKFKGNEIVWAKLNGKKIKKNKKYLMVTVDYLANGGDYMESFKNAEVLYTDDVKYSIHILNYIKDLDAKGIMVDGEDRIRMHK